jgi:DNA-binding GntR family transcriptional regulator
MPAIERPDPPYMQVVKHIRQKIDSGALAPDDLIPSARKITKEWNVSLATAAKVHATLRAEGLVEGVSGVGSKVKARTRGASARDRMQASSRGRIYRKDEYARIVAAKLASAPEQVADALGVAVGAPVLRRERVTYQKNDEPVSASVSWFDGALVSQATRLLEAERIVEGTPAYIQAVTGRQMTSGRDQITAASATEAEAEALQVPVGTPVMRGRNWVYDGDGAVLEYGESVAAAGRWRSYDYEIN